MAAVVSTQIADSAAVSFGAAGVPVTYGIGSLGAEYIPAVTHHVALIHALLSPIIPLLIILTLTRYYGRKKSWKEGWEAAPFAAFAGLAFGIPMLAAAWTLGPELASIIGAAIGLPLVILAARKGFLMPRTTWDFDDRKRWPALWTGDHIVHKHNKLAGPIASILPYLIVILLLLVTRLDALPFKALLKNASFSLGIGTQQYIFTLLYSPVAVFLAGCLVAILLFRLSRKDITCELKAALWRLTSPLVALVCAIATVQLFISSAVNPASLPSMPLALASVASALGKDIFIFASPFIGIFGAVIAGSNTVSNLLFGSFQLHAASQLGLSVALILALQTVGGAAGNMIAVHNVIAASSTTGLHHVEGHIIRRTLIPCLIYGLLAGIVGYIILALA
jgi:lactate permease